MSKKVFCIIPAYNEEKMIAVVIRGLEAYVDRIIVVDDCSRDRTAEVAREQGATVLRHAVNRDQGAALATGNEYALSQGAEIIVHFDADGQFAASDIPLFLEALSSDDCDMVIGSRFLGKKSDMPFTKEHIIFPVARLVNRLFFNIRLTDPQNGFRAMTRAAAEKIKIEQDGKAHCSEIITKAFRYKLRVKEVPITVTYHRYGQRFGGGVRIVMDFLLSTLSK